MIKLSQIAVRHSSRQRKSDKEKKGKWEFAREEKLTSDTNTAWRVALRSYVCHVTVGLRTAFMASSWCDFELASLFFQR